jgi:hypothetical protein
MSQAARFGFHATHSWTSVAAVFGMAIPQEFSTRGASTERRSLTDRATPQRGTRC